MSAATEVDEFLANIATQFAPGAQILSHSSGDLSVTVHPQTARISWSPVEIDELVTAMRRSKGTAYFANLKRRFRIKVAISLLQSGVSPDLRIAQELTLGGDEWPANKFIDIELANPFAQIIADGMRSLYETLTDLITTSPIEVTEVADDAANIHYLVRYYEEASNLSSRGVGKENLGYIKAADICAITQLEEKRQATNISRIKSALNDQIASIAQWVESDPYSKIPTPQCATEYLQSKNGPHSPRIEVPQLDSILVLSNDRLEKYLEALGPQFTRRRHGAWETFRSVNPDKLSQAANSMVELLDKVLGLLCDGTTLEEILNAKFGAPNEKKWVQAALKWISETKSNLHRVKHHDGYTSPNLVESFMKSAENVMEVLLADK